MKNFVPLIIIASIFTSCAVPAPVVKLSPSTVQNGDYWNMGQQFVFVNDNNVWFDCAFNRLENGKLVFDVKVSNLSDSAILVDPAMFSQMVFKDDSLKIGQNYATNPEVVLTRLQLNENIEHARSRNSATLGFCSALIAGGAMVAVATSKKDEESKQNMYAAIAVSHDVVQTSAAIASESADIRAEGNWNARRSLSEMFLRKTTLPKGYFIDGEVHFPYYNTAKWYNIILASGKAKADFLFMQNLIYPPTTATTANTNGF